MHTEFKRCDMLVLQLAKLSYGKDGAWQTWQQALMRTALWILVQPQMLLDGRDGSAARPVALPTSRVSSHLRQMHPNVNVHRTHVSVYTKYINHISILVYDVQVIYYVTHYISISFHMYIGLPVLYQSLSPSLFLSRSFWMGNVTHLVAVEHVHCLPSMYAEAPDSMT